MVNLRIIGKKHKKSKFYKFFHIFFILSLYNMNANGLKAVQSRRFYKGGFWIVGL